MDTFDRKWRAIRIAAEYLYRYCRDIAINKVNNDVYDMIVVEPGSSLKFGVKVASSTFVKSNNFSQYIDLLSKIDFDNNLYKIPIVIMCVNESEDTVKFGFVVSWHKLRPTIYKNITLNTFNNNNWILFTDKLKMMDSTIRILSQIGLKVVKKIIISEQDANGIIHNGVFVYLRDFTSKYKMMKRNVTDEKEKFQRLLFGIPTEEYPNDALDILINKKVHELYPSAQFKSSLLLFNTELRDLQLYGSFSQKQYSIEILPDLNSANQFFKDMLVCFNINIFLFYQSQQSDNFFNSQVLTETCPANKLKSTLNEYMELKRTMHNISEFFI